VVIWKRLRFRSQLRPSIENAKSRGVYSGLCGPQLQSRVYQPGLFSMGKAVKRLELEGEPQAEFDLTRSTERVDAGSDSHAVYVVPAVCGSVDLPGSSRQQST
jgi:hypothetical protein